MKYLIVLSLCLSYVTAIAQSDRDTIFLVEQDTSPYGFKTPTGDVVSNSRYLHGYIVNDFEFYVQIPKDYKKVAFYVDEDVEPTIIIYNLKKGYHPVFLPIGKKVWATMDGDVYERVNFNQKK